MGEPMSVLDITARDTALEAARVGNARAFVGLLEPHRQTLWAVCLRITNEPRHAVDALAHGVGQAWRTMACFPPDVPFGLWLSRALATAARTVAWHQQRSAATSTGAMPAPTVATDGGERLIQMRLEMLPVVVREAIALRQLCGLTYEQIATHQGIGVHTVKERLRRAVGLQALDAGPRLDKVHFDQLLRSVFIRQLQEDQRKVSR